MNGDIRLYIDDRQVDLGENPKVLYNWILTDFTNPTISKNSYSKTITIEGTKSNDDIFGHFWDLDRIQGYGGNTGVNFNPTYRVPFSLFINGDLFEKGYVKLQSVKKDGGKTAYEIGLFGALGNFLYNLQTDWNSGEKKTLGNLKYFDNDNQPLDLGFTINKETVQSAWTEIDSYSSKWTHINFAPCYNGVNDKLTTDKAVVNYNRINSEFVSGVTEDGEVYKTVNGYALATLPGKLTEWETADLRSWAQRPVVRVKTVLDAICRKENNKGRYDDGYDVVLDGDFFTSTNPYYEDAWMTLPLINNLNIKTNGEINESYTANYVASYTGTDFVELVYALDSPIEKFGCNAELNFDLMINVPGSNNEAKLYPSGVFGTGGWWGHRFNSHSKFTNVYAVQGFTTKSTAQNNAAVAGSDVIWCEHNREEKSTLPYTYQQAHTTRGSYYTLMDSYKPRFETEGSTLIEGYFVHYSGKNYRWNSQIQVTIPLPQGTQYFRLRIDRKTNLNYFATGNPRAFLFTKDTVGRSGDIITGSTVGVTSVANRLFYIKSGSLTNFYSGLKISQADLLKTSFTPAEWLMDYCRMFGLYVHKDLATNRIFIDTRKNFFLRNEIEDISEKIDYGRDMTMKPCLAEAGYYRMKDSFLEGRCYKDYSDKYSQPYGNKTIATGYQYDAETKDLISSKLKGGVQARGNGLYYFKPNWTHPYIYNGVTYNLYKGGIATSDTVDMSIKKMVLVESFRPFEENLPYYDFDDKVEFCDSSNKALDGSYVLLFHQGETSVAGMEYYLSDDLDIMSRLNNNPCYLQTCDEYDLNGNKVAIALDFLPKFTRYWYSTSYFGSGTSVNNVIFSLDFGSPRQLYLLNYIDYEKSNLYSQFYRTYYEDMYDVNTKAVTLYWKPTGILSSDALRKFYWFENCLWRLNQVIDYSPIANDLVKCQFVKVQDIENMTCEIPTKEVEMNVVLSQYYIDGSGGTITATVTSTDMGGWYLDGWDYDDEITISPLTGATDGTFTITVPAYYGVSDRQVGITVACGDIAQRVYFTQGFLTGGTQSISLTAATPISSAQTAINYSVNANPAGTVYLYSGSTLLGQNPHTGNTSGFFSVGANTTQNARNFTLSAVTADGLHSDVKTVVQNAAGTGPTPPSPDYNIYWGMIGVDKQHSDIDGWNLPYGSVEVYTGATQLGNADLYGDESNLSLVGLSFTGSSLTAATIIFDLSQLSWNTALHPDIAVDITLNADQQITLTSNNGLTGGFSAIDLTQYAAGTTITLDFIISVRDDN